MMNHLSFVRFLLNKLLLVADHTFQEMIKASICGKTSTKLDYVSNFPELNCKFCCLFLKDITLAQTQGSSF